MNSEFQKYIMQYKKRRDMLEKDIGDLFLKCVREPLYEPARWVYEVKLWKLIGDYKALLADYRNEQIRFSIEGDTESRMGKW